MPVMVYVGRYGVASADEDNPVYDAWSARTNASLEGAIHSRALGCCEDGAGGAMGMVRVYAGQPERRDR